MEKLEMPQTMNIPKPPLFGTCIAIILLNLIFIGCREDDAAPEHITIAFERIAEDMIEEGGDTLTVRLILSSAATGTGVFDIKLREGNGVAYGADYETIPAAESSSITMIVLQGATEITFRVIPLDDNEEDEEKEVIFDLGVASEGFVFGENNSLLLTINDNDTPNTAFFKRDNATIIENEGDGLPIEISMSTPPVQTGTLTLSYASEGGAIYGTDFTTVPEPVDGKLMLPLVLGQQKVVFNVIPIDHTAMADKEKAILFTLASATDGIHIGRPNTFEVNIIDDSPHREVLAISDIIKLYEGAERSIEEAVYLQGVVISMNATSSPGTLQLQDTTGGITVRFDANVPEGKPFDAGDEIQLYLKKSRLSKIDGVMTLSHLSVKDSLHRKVSVENSVEAKLATLTELLTGKHMSTLVKLENIFFEGANGAKTFNGTTWISDGSEKVSLFTSETAPYTDDIIPIGEGSITGIAFTSEGKPNLMLRSLTDVQLKSKAKIELEESITDFGPIKKRQISSVQEYSVTGINIGRDILISSSEHFEVSKDNIHFDSETTIPFTGADTLMTKVYIRFKPNSGINRIIEGAIQHSSTGAEVKILNVTGTEIGNTIAPKRSILTSWTFEGDVSTAAVDMNGGAVISTNSGGKTSFSNGNGDDGSWSNNHWDTDEYIEISVNTTGFEELRLQFDDSASGTGPKGFKLQYSIDGIDFMDLDGAEINTNASFSASPMHDFDLSAIAVLNNNTQIKLRLVIVTPASESSGTWRLDNVNVLGEN